MSHRILLLDSGLGGLTVLSAIRQQLPSLHLDYVADHAWFPYGDRASEQLGARLVTLIGAAQRESGHRYQVIVVACNTASTAALEQVRAALPDARVVGVVPAVKPAAATTQTGHIAVLATPGTSRSPYLRGLVAQFVGPDQTAALIAAPSLAALAERKLLGDAVTSDEVAADLGPLMTPEGADIDTVVLGCTHYPWLLQTFQQLAPQVRHWIDSGPAIARRVQFLLDQARAQDRVGTASEVARAQPQRFWTTDPSAAIMLNPQLAAVLAELGLSAQALMPTAD